MSSTEGSNTAYTGSMSSTEPRVQHPQDRTPKYRQYSQHRTSKYGEYWQCIFPKYCQYFSSPPVAPTERSSLQLPLVGASVKVFCQITGMKLSTLQLCTDRRSVLHTPSILRILRVFRYCEHSQYSQYQRTKYCQHWQYPEHRTPKYWKYKECSNQSRNTASPEHPQCVCSSH